jgi:hypothetical protein
MYNILHIYILLINLKILTAISIDAGQAGLEPTSKVLETLILPIKLLFKNWDDRIRTYIFEFKAQCPT